MTEQREARRGCTLCTARREGACFAVDSMGRLAWVRMIWREGLARRDGAGSSVPEQLLE